MFSKQIHYWKNTSQLQMVQVVGVYLQFIQKSKTHQCEFCVCRPKSIKELKLKILQTYEVLTKNNWLVYSWFWGCSTIFNKSSDIVYYTTVYYISKFTSHYLLVNCHTSAWWPAVMEPFASTGATSIVWRKPLNHKTK